MNILVTAFSLLFCISSLSAFQPSEVFRRTHRMSETSTINIHMNIDKLMHIYASYDPHISVKVVYDKPDESKNYYSVEFTKEIKEEINFDISNLLVHEFHISIPDTTKKLVVKSKGNVIFDFIYATVTTNSSSQKWGDLNHAFCINAYIYAKKLSLSTKKILYDVNDELLPAPKHTKRKSYHNRKKHSEETSTQKQLSQKLDTSSGSDKETPPTLGKTGRKYSLPPSLIFSNISPRQRERLRKEAEAKLLEALEKEEASDE